MVAFFRFAERKHFLPAIAMAANFVPPAIAALATSGLCSKATAQAKKVDSTSAAWSTSSTRQTPTRAPYSVTDSAARLRISGGVA
tara:strand:+ start:297 stop:551 length:255 start_codon:yes stop_codon:yes gene_type:complete